jgi:hypothetical protein
MIDGVGVMVGAQHAQSFSLALRELATNAAKYGALSSESGRVKIFGAIARDGKENRLKFKWKETGGPPVVAPTSHGFGTSLLRATFADVRIDYLVEGLTCEIDLVLGRAEPVNPGRDPTGGKFPQIKLGCPLIIGAHLGFWLLAFTLSGTVLGSTCIAQTILRNFQ